MAIKDGAVAAKEAITTQVEDMKMSLQDRKQRWNEGTVHETPGTLTDDGMTIFVSFDDDMKEYDPAKRTLTLMLLVTPERTENVIIEAVDHDTLRIKPYTKRTDDFMYALSLRYKSGDNRTLQRINYKWCADGGMTNNCIHYALTAPLLDGIRMRHQFNTSNDVLKVLNDGLADF